MYKFHAFGHKNILSTHPTTLEFTKDSEVTKKGNCIVGIKADFSVAELRKFKGKVKISIKVESIEDELTAEINPKFNDSHELVIRKSDFISGRTFAIKANKASSDLKKGLVEKFKIPGKKIEVTVSTNR
ncbi:DUF371 domain-containing protein [Candidatus Woesearchaeota archaeon]|nr:DUF371 domain-containing protein [Candidatus Woesearchaeota archaeon]